MIVATAVCLLWFGGTMFGPVGPRETPTPPPAAIASTSSGAVFGVGSGGLASELPPVEPGPQLAPILEPSPPAPAEELPRPASVLRSILGLVLIAALAYAAGLGNVRAWEERAGISQVITSGLPFVVLGYLARLPSIGIVNDSILGGLSPLLRIGLGWIGFVTGFRFDLRDLVDLRPPTARLVTLLAAFPFIAALAATGALLFLTTGLTQGRLADPIFVRDAIILGTAAAMSAPAIARKGGGLTALPRIEHLDALAGITGLAIVAAYFRPAGAEVAWRLPGLAWLLLTVGLGVALGALSHAILLNAANSTESSALMIGVVSLVAGVAGYLHLSSVVVAFIAGVSIANTGSKYVPEAARALERLERPIYLISLFVIGSIWDVADWRGWCLAPVFVIARIAGKRAALRVAGAGESSLSGTEREELGYAPVGVLAIAIVVNAQLLYPGGSISRIVSAVIGGAILTEIVVQWQRAVRRQEPAA